MLELIKEPWSWYTSGIVIVLIMLFLIFSGKSFGFSSNLRTICAACGAGKHVPLFDFNWKSQIWNILFLIGSIAGGYIANEFLSNEQSIAISESTIADLSELGFSSPEGFQPKEVFGNEEAFTLKGFLVLLIGGFLVGFGARYAGGCTSGHAISGLSNLQLPSLIAVVGFFIGGLIMTFVVLPLIY
jgi:uncharacterized protein